MTPCTFNPNETHAQPLSSVSHLIQSPRQRLLVTTIPDMGYFDDVFYCFQGVNWYSMATHCYQIARGEVITVTVKNLDRF